MKKLNMRVIASVMGTLLFLCFATATGDSNDKESSGSHNSSSTQKKSKPAKSKTTPVNPQEVKEPEKVVEEVRMYNSSESENASDEDEEIVIITNDTDEE